MDILMILKNREVLFANTTFMHASGLSVDDLIGNTCDEVSIKNFHSYRLPFMTCPIERVIASSNPQIVTDTFIDKTGNTQSVNIIGALTKISDSDDACLYMSIPAQKLPSDASDSEMALIKGYKLIDMLAQIYHQEYKITTILNELDLTKKTLESKTSEFNHLYGDIVNREIKMRELKQQIYLMQQQLNQGNHAS